MNEFAHDRFLKTSVKHSCLTRFLIEQFGAGHFNSSARVQKFKTNTSKRLCRFMHFVIHLIIILYTQYCVLRTKRATLHSSEVSSIALFAPVVFQSRAV